MGVSVLAERMGDYPRESLRGYPSFSVSLEDIQQLLGHIKN